MIENRFHICTNIGIGVFIDRQTRRSVLDEHVQQSNSQMSNFWDSVNYFIGDQMKPARLGG